MESKRRSEVEDPGKVKKNQSDRFSNVVVTLVVGVVVIVIVCVVGEAVSNRFLKKFVAVRPSTCAGLSRSSR